MTTQIAKLLPVVALVFLFGCQDDEQVTQQQKSVSIAGYVQKGPFINGTAITVSELDQKLIATGKNFTTQIIDNKGAFGLKDIQLQSDFVQLIAEGFYFDEVRGEKSAAQLTLFALADVSDASSVNVNLLSHLEKDRVMYLMQEEEKSFTTAKQQAQREILAVFGIEKNNMASSELLDISQGGEDNAILLAISATLQGNNSVAELSELLADIITDIREDGVMDSESTREKIRVNAMSLTLADIRKHLEVRYEELGVDATISNFEQYIDSDGDGFLNKNEDDTPDDFAFEPQVDVAVSIPILSNEIVISGLKEGGFSNITLSNGQLIINGQVMLNSIAQVKNGDKLKLQTISSSNYADETITLIQIGSYEKHFSVTTDDYAPDDFTFAQIEHAKRDSIYYAATVALSGLLYSTPITLDQGVLIINNREVDPSAAMVVSEDKIKIKLKSSPTFKTKVTASLSIGTMTKKFDVITESDPWQLKAMYPGDARGGMTGFDIGNKLYVGTGFSSGNSYENEFYEYNLSTGTWTRLEDFAGLPRAYAVGFSIGNKGYIGLGASNEYYDDFWEYDPTKDIWTKIASFPGTARKGATCFTVGNLAYIGSGESGYNYYEDFWKYNPKENLWSQAASLGNSGRTLSIGFSIGDKGYVGTGTNGVSYYNDFWEYDYLKDQWTEKQALENAGLGSAPFGRVIGFSISGYGYTNYNHHGSELYSFDLSTNSWVETGYRTPLSSGGTILGLSTNQKSYVLSGGAVSGVNLWEFTPPQE